MTLIVVVSFLASLFLWFICMATHGYLDHFRAEFQPHRTMKALAFVSILSRLIALVTGGCAGILWIIVYTPERFAIQTIAAFLALLWMATKNNS